MEKALTGTDTCTGDGTVFTSTQVVLSLQFTTFEITDVNGAAVVVDAPLLVKTVGVKSLMKKTIL